MDADEGFTPWDDEGEQLVPLGQVLSVSEQATAMAARDMADQLLREQGTQPNALQAERAVLGALLMDPASIEAVIAAGLRIEHFYRPAHGTIYRAILDLQTKGSVVDVLTVVERLQELGQLDAVGGVTGVSQLEALLPTSAHAEAYAKLVREKAVLRKLLGALKSVAESCYRQNKPVGEIVDDAERAFLEVRDSHTGDVAHVDREAIAAEILSEVGKPRRGVIPTGFPALDERLGGGLENGTMTVIGGRPAMGKSALAACIIANVVDDVGIPGLYVSLEMLGKKVLRREIARRAKLPFKAWDNATREQHSRLTEAASFVAQRPLYVLDRNGMSFSALASRIRHYVRARGVGIVAIDYLQLLTGDESYRSQGDKNNEVGEISKGLAMLGRELGIPTIVVSQLNRGVEGRADRRPMMSDLRDTGAIEQDADNILFAYRPEYYLKEKCPEELRGVAEIIGAKFRDGEVGSVTTKFSGATFDFVPLSEERGAA